MIFFKYSLPTFTITEEKLLKKEFSVTTDNNGNFKATGLLDVPGLLTPNLDVNLRLFEREELKVNGTFDIDATDGDPLNQPKAINNVCGGGKNGKKDWGKWVYCGKFRMDYGNQKFYYEASGTTDPPTPNTTLKFEADVW